MRDPATATPAAALLLLVAACAPPGSGSQVYLTFDAEGGTGSAAEQLELLPADGWQIRSGHLLARVPAASTGTARLLSRRLAEQDGLIEMSVRIGAASGGARSADNAPRGEAGFLLGPGRLLVAVRLPFVADPPTRAAGALVVRDLTGGDAFAPETFETGAAASTIDGPISLALRAFYEEAAPGYRVELQVRDAAGNDIAKATYRQIPDDLFREAISLTWRPEVASAGTAGPWFDDWWLWGNKLLPIEAAPTQEPSR